MDSEFEFDALDNMEPALEGAEDFTPDEPCSPLKKTVRLFGIQKRITNIFELNNKFAILQAPHMPSVYVSRADFMPVRGDDLARRLSGDVVKCKTRSGKVRWVDAYKFWTQNAGRHVYRRVVFTSKETSNDSFNLFSGLGVKPAPGECGLIIKHVHEVICSGDKVASEAMLDLLAWQLQNIGEPSRIVVVLHNPRQQAGKGILLEELMLKIYGPSGFSASTADQVLGKFNDAIRGKAFVFMDEIMFAGDLRTANAVKALATTTLKGIETKGLPVVACPIAVNLWLASNDESPVHIEDGDARYWCLKVSEHRIGDHDYFDKLETEINNGGRGAFAHYLLSRDVSQFVPRRDVPKDNQDRREIIEKSINPLNARRWMEECATCEQISATQKTDFAGNICCVPWVHGESISYAALWNAYTKWQAGVKTKASFKPTPSNRSGQFLGKVGFQQPGYHGSDRRRLMPKVDDCLKSLADAELWKGWIW